MKKNNTGYCPNCMANRVLREVTVKETIPVRGEVIAVDATYLRCEECGEDFIVPGVTNDYLAAAYRIYRTRHGWMQPEEIKNLRKSYGLTQNELSALLGWGQATIGRYEKGALQDEAHETTLKVVNNPRSFLALVQVSAACLNPGKRMELTRRILLRGFAGKPADDALKANWNPSETTTKRADLTNWTEVGSTARNYMAECAQALLVA